MKIVDNNGKVFGKVNLVDLGIVILIILAIAAVGVKLMNEKGMTAEKAKISYTLLVEGVRQPSVDAINKEYKGIVDAEKEKPLGDITDVKVENAKTLVIKEDGEYVISEIPDKYDLHITIETVGTVSGEGYFTGDGKKLLYGDTIGISNGYSQTFGVVENIAVK